MNEQPESDLPQLFSTSVVSFPIVGIGASAGGLPALLRLLENMPPAPGMALVVALHLAADAPSAADRVLQRVTDMPVVQVADRVALRPNQVYVVPPGRSLKVEDNHLVADPALSGLGMPMTINIFLRTLAEAHGERAIGVLLSGMGSDGVAGLACIKEHGGVAIAQLPGDAEERSMPQAAIDSGMVDFVLPAAQIPARLVEMREVMQAMRAGGLQGNAPLPELPLFDMGEYPQEQLEEILSLLVAQTGHDFRHYKHATLMRRIERRMQVRAEPDLHAYQRLLAEDPHEPEALAQELLIGVTNFFRDHAAFDALEQSILPRIFHERKPSDPLRAWVAACSTGEEAYSLAMLLAERAECIEGAPAMQIFATDIDERAIVVARAGRYPDAIAADVAPARLARFFTPEDRYFRVRKLLRDHILFARHDLVHDPAFSQLDLITCRNVLIYLNRDMHRQLLEVFHSALNPGGYLFLGCAESADLAPDLFVAIDSRHRLYQARPAAKTSRRLSIKSPHTASGRPAAGPGQAPPDPGPASPGYAELHQRTLARLAPPSVLVDAGGDIVHASEGAGAFLHFGGGEPSIQLLALIPADVRADLRAALFQARKSGQAAHTGPIRYRQEGEERAVALSVVPVREPGAEGLQLVRFEAVEAAPLGAAPGEPVDPRVRALEEALLQARRTLQQSTEQADAVNAGLTQANERLQATVEALRAEIEEFEVHREEMQSRNEELYTVNAELEARAEETAQANDDLSNLIASSDIATLFLDPRLRIQRYTPSITRIFNIIPADVGRPLSDLTGKLETARLLNEAVGVFASGEPTEREARSSDGCHYIVRVHPYRTAYNRVEGAVLTFFDISRRRAAEKAQRESEQRLALAFSALPLGLAIVDPDGNTIMLNEVMRRFMPTGLVPLRDAARAVWRGWDAAGSPVTPEDFPGARALRGESVMCGMQMLYTDDEGRETWTEVRSAPLRDGEGNITGALLAVVDVDRLKRGEETAQQSAHRHAFLLKLGDALRAQPDEQSIKELAVRMLADRLRLDRCWISEVAEEKGMSTVGPEHFRADLPPMAGTFTLSDYPETMRQLACHPVAVEDAADDARFSESEKRLLDSLQLRALLVAPLRRGQSRVIWALAAGMAAPRQWDDGERVLLEEAAERTWMATERARAERRAENILERMSEAHCVLGPDYCILALNAAAERMLGRPRTTLLGLSYWDAFPWTVDGPVHRACRRVVEEGVEQHFAYHCQGGGYDVHLEMDVHPTAEGGVAMFWRDVTERVQAGLALQASEERYRTLFNKMDEAFAVVEVIADAAGHWTDFLFLEVNPAFMRHTGMPYPVGRTATQLLGTPNPHWAALYGRVVETGEPIRVEEGELMLGRVFDLNIFRLGGEGSRRVAVLFTDITSRKDAEAALRESEARFRSLADASPALIWQLDAAGALNYVNGRCLDITGTSVEQLCGAGWHCVLHPDDAAGYLDALARALDTQGAFQQRVRVRTRDGRHRWFASYALPWHAVDGRFQGLVGISIDVEEAAEAGEP